MKTMICQCCGIECERTSNVQKFCLECRNKKQAERNNAYKKRKADGFAKSLGTTDICQICGKSFIRTSGNQNLCSDCIKKGLTLNTKSNSSEITEEERHNKNVANAKLQTQLYDVIKAYLPKGRKEELQILADSCGLSLSKFIIAAIDNYEQQILENMNSEKQ